MTTNRFLGFFLKLLSRYMYGRLSKNSFVRFFLWRGTSREFVARLVASQPEKLARLAKKLAVVSMGFFQKLCHLLAIFLDCSRSPCPLISKPALSKTILSSSFVWETRTKTDKLFFKLVVTRSVATSFLRGLQYANVSLTHSGVDTVRN